MEFQYCDNCGDITQGSHGSGSDMLCASCAGSESAPGPASGLQLLDDPSGLGDDLSGNGAAKEKLDLFTSDPIAPSQARSAAPSHSSLKLVTDSSAVSNAAKGTSNGPSDAHPAVEFQDNLPPDQSPAERKPGSAAFGIGSPPLIEEDAMDMTQKMLGSLNQEPERWRVDCLHCAGSLSVKPAMKKSRLKCPRCQGVMVLDPSGTVRSVGATVGNASPSSTSRSAVTTTAPSASSSPNRAKEVPASPGESVAVLRESPVVAEESSKQSISFQSPPGRAPQMQRLQPVADSVSARIPDRAESPTNTARSSTVSVPQPEAPAEQGGMRTVVASPPIADPGPAQHSDREDRIAEPSRWLQEGAYTGSGVPTTEPVGADPVGADPVGKEAVNSATSLFWVTLALLPSALGILIVHESSGPLGESILNELGLHISKNSGTLLDWCARILGK